MYTLSSYVSPSATCLDEGESAFGCCIVRIVSHSMPTHQVTAHIMPHHCTPLHIMAHLMPTHCIMAHLMPTHCTIVPHHRTAPSHHIMPHHGTTPDTIHGTHCTQLGVHQCTIAHCQWHTIAPLHTAIVRIASPTYATICIAPIRR